MVHWSLVVSYPLRSRLPEYSWPSYKRNINAETRLENQYCNLTRIKPDWNPLAILNFQVKRIRTLYRLRYRKMNVRHSLMSKLFCYNIAGWLQSLFCCLDCFIIFFPFARNKMKNAYTKASFDKSDALQTRSSRGRRKNRFRDFSRIFIPLSNKQFVASESNQVEICIRRIHPLATMTIYWTVELFVIQAIWTEMEKNCSCLLRWFRAARIESSSSSSLDTIQASFRNRGVISRDG